MIQKLITYPCATARAHKGFTLVEILVVVTAILVFSAIAISGTIIRSQQKARDTERVNALKDFKEALALYYAQNSHYPPVCTNANGDNGNYSYKVPPACTVSYSTTGGFYDLRWDNSYKPLFLNILYPNYTIKNNWADPLGGNCGDSGTCGNDIIELGREWNCRYVIPKTTALDADNSGGLGVNCPDPTTYKEIQSYYMYCRLEVLRDTAGKNDGGWSDKLYEIYEPSSWLCVTDTYS